MKSIMATAAAFLATASATDLDSEKLLVNDAIEFRRRSEPGSDLLKTYTDKDFEGLYKYLEEDACLGPNLPSCSIRELDAADVAGYLLDIDRCLFVNRCLSYHQILSYKHKINGSNDYQNSQTISQNLPPINSASTSSLDDLQLAEVNFLCIEASLSESHQSARQNMFNHCVDHLEKLFEQEEYVQAINTTFVTQASTYSWQMVTIFCVVFGIIALSIFLMCKFMGNKDKRKRPRREGEQNRDRESPRMQQYRDYAHQSDQDSSEDFRKEHRIPRAKARNSSSHHNYSAPQSKHFGGEGSSAVFGEFDRGSGLNVPLLDYSEGTGSHDERSSK